MFKLPLNEYNIFIGEMGAPLRELVQQGRYSKIAVLTDANTRRHCLPYFLQQIDFEAVEIETPAGELHKNIDTCRHIWAEMIRFGLDRHSLLLNLGGGVIGDMGGFCAATYLRGIDFIQIPTTLLSQVDASVGGKLAIDFNFVKNSIGVFQNPKAVLVDPVFLKTLPEGELRSGFAEVFKHALIADAAQWRELQKISSLHEVDWPSLLVPSLSIKKRIVEADPTEQGLRKALNFGHTIGHAVESFSMSDFGFRISAGVSAIRNPQSAIKHGEAVALGILCESWLSWKLAGLPEADLQEIMAFVQRFYPHYPLRANDLPAVFDLMKKDKKNVGGRINFTLLPAIGQAVIDQFVEVGLIEESLEFYMAQR